MPALQSRQLCQQAPEPLSYRTLLHLGAAHIANKPFHLKEASQEAPQLQIYPPQWLCCRIKGLKGKECVHKVVAALKEVHLPPDCSQTPLPVFHCSTYLIAFVKARLTAYGRQRAAEPWKRV